MTGRPALASACLAAAALLMAACGGGEKGLELTITSPTGDDVLREEPFLVTGSVSREPDRPGVWLLVGSMADGQYYPVSRIAVAAEGEAQGPHSWSAQFYNGVCQESFVPGAREVMLVRADTDLLGDIADSLALKQPLTRPQLEEDLLASVIVSIEKPDETFCVGALPPEGPAPSGGDSPPEGSP